MKQAQNILAAMKDSSKAMAATLLLIFASVINTFANNPIDSDLSNTAGSNSGKSHLDIYLFIVALLVICVVLPFWEDRRKKRNA